MAEISTVRLNLVKKKNTKIIVWNYFGIKADENGVQIPGEESRPICRTCHKTVLSKGGNTTNLFVHLRDGHPALYKEATKPSKGKEKEGRQPTLEATMERGSYYDPRSKQAQELDHAVAYYLAKDMQPYYTVERPGFKKIVSKLNPRYKLHVPSRKHFSQQEIPRLYNLVKETMVSPKLTQMDYFSATTDLWTSRATHPYLSYTVHFLDSNWELQSISLETVPLFTDHTGENIVESIQDILANWNLPPEKLVVTTTDNGSNFVAGFQTHGWLRLSCFGHCLDLAINKCLAIRRVERAVSRCNALVASFSRSWKKQRDLREKQTQLGLPDHKLVGAVTTRWGSSYNMVVRILEQQQALSAVLAEDRKSWHLMPTDTEFSVLEALAEVIKPLSVLTDALSGEKEVTSSAVRPILKHVMDICEPKDGDNTLTHEMKLAISSDLDVRYESAVIASLIDKCSFLDPRFKVDHVADKDLVKSNLEAEIVEQCDQSNDFQSTTNEEIDATVPPPAKKPKGLNAILNKLPKAHAQQGETFSQAQRIKKEITNYLDQPCEETDSDPLLWWKIHSKYFPHLATMARKYLSIPGTSVPSERVFSKGGIIVDPFRSLLSPHHVNTLIFLSGNME